MVHQVNPPANPFLLELIGMGFDVQVESSTGAMSVNGVQLMFYKYHPNFEGGFYDPATDVLHLQPFYAGSLPFNDFERALVYAVTQHELGHWVLDDFLEQHCHKDPACQEALDALYECHRKKGKACQEAFAAWRSFMSLCAKTADPATAPGFKNELLSRAKTACDKGAVLNTQCANNSGPPPGGCGGPLPTPQVVSFPTPCVCTSP